MIFPLILLTLFVVLFELVLLLLLFDVPRITDDLSLLEGLLLLLLLLLLITTTAPLPAVEPYAAAAADTAACLLKGYYESMILGGVRFLFEGIVTFAGRACLKGSYLSLELRKLDALTAITALPESVSYCCYC
jgi:hypothetical protein